VGWGGRMRIDNLSLNWNNIRPINGDQKEGFEEFVAQLARIEKIQGAKRFIRKGTPDAGVECYWILEDDSEWAWQAKYFTSYLGGSQWSQINESVKTAIESHPNLAVYIIALPINPADDRKAGRQSLQNKWDSHKQKWQEIAKDKGRTILFTPWWSSDLISILQKRENIDIIRFWFNSDFLSDDWFNKHIKKSVADLQQRYTPELNYQMPIVNIFDGIAKDKKFAKQLFEALDPLLLEINNLTIRDENDDNNKNIKEVKEYAKVLETEYKTIVESSIEYYDFNRITEICNKIQSKLYYFNYKNNDRRYVVTKIIYLLSDFQEFINSVTVKLFTQPYLLIYGEAGIGKSHLMGDIVTLRKSEGKHSLLLLGQQFNTNENPITQILKNLDLDCSFGELLTALSCRAQIEKNRLIIFIDAMNEGKGKEFWPDYFNGFLTEIAQYPWLGLVFTIRDTYLDIIKKNIEFIGNRLLLYEYKGFSQDEYNAVKMFFSFYGIEQPSNPLLNPEFQNPLFIKMYCESLKSKKLTRIPDGFQGISELIDTYINSINDSLWEPKRLNYSRTNNLVLRAINTVIKYMVENKTRWVPFETALEIVESIVTKYVTIKGKFLDELISEGVFSKNLMGERNRNNEYIYFTYERMADHLISKFLIDSSSNLEEDMKSSGHIYQFLTNSEDFPSINSGLVESIAILLPEKTGKEIYEILDITKFPEIGDAFIKSLKWRKLDTITADCRDFIINYILKDGDNFELFIDTIISISTLETHFFNAYFLHNFLLKYSLSDRDAIWTYYLKYKYSETDPVKRIIDWAWNDEKKENVSDESIKLASIILSWFLSSPKRDLRDASTKALISILQNRINILIDVLKLFETVNDPYVYERLFAVAFGCVIRTTQKKQIKNLAEYVFEIIFNKEDEIYPHILLRDYARSIIEYAIYLNLPVSIDISRIKPPYKSHLEIKEFSNEEIEEKYRSTKNNERHGQDSIISSMATESSKRGYGDFGRYIFESNFFDFPVKSEVLSNMAINLIFEKYGYSEKKHGDYELYLPYNGRQSKSSERIGKKYQWMAMHELLARVTDNCKKQYKYDTEDSAPYQGPWDPFVRDIDPTILIKQAGYITKNEKHRQNWWKKDISFNLNCSIDKWLSNEDELSELKSIIKIRDDKEKNWLIIQAYPQWSEKRRIGEKRWEKEEKEVLVQIRSYICKKSDLPKILKWAKGQNFSGCWMPINADKYVLFLRERYWSPAYRYCMEEDSYGNLLDIWEEIKDKNIEKVIAPVIIPTEEYTWEKNTDYSINETFEFILPSKYVFDNLEMKYGDEEGEYNDANNQLICYNPSVKYNTQQYLLIKEEPFIQFLKEHDFEVFWTILGEKQIIGGDFRGFHGRLDFSGIYYLKDNGSIDGSITTFRLPGSI
jgi:hypothetical protein